MLNRKVANIENYRCTLLDQLIGIPKLLNNSKIKSLDRLYPKPFITNIARQELQRLRDNILSANEQTIHEIDINPDLLAEQISNRIRLDLQVQTLRWEGRIDARIVQRLLQGSVDLVVTPPPLRVGLDPPPHPVDHGIVTHLVVDDVHRFVGQHPCDWPYGVRDDLFHSVVVSAIGNTNVGLDPVPGIGIGVVDNLGLAQG